MFELAERRDALRGLDGARRLIEALADAHRVALAALLSLWSTEGWRQSGIPSPARWLCAYTTLPPREIAGLVRLTGLCAEHRRLAEVVVSGRLSWARATVLATVATPAREAHLGGCLDAIVDLGLDPSCTDDRFERAVRYWAERADEVREVAEPAPHAVTLTPRLFGGGTVHAELAPAAFETVAAALDAWIQDPDPADAPYRRTLPERRADALDDLATFGLTHDPDRSDPHVDRAEEEALAGDTWDGTVPVDDLDLALAEPDLDPLERLRLRARASELTERRRARRRTRARSGVAVNVHVDLATLADVLDPMPETDRLLDRRGVGLDGLELSVGDGWTLSRRAADLLLCDAGLLATIFNGPGHVLDANDRAEHFNRAQRRALAARDRGCVFPGCGRAPQFCDAHHLREHSRGGSTTVDNGAMLCRFHHRLVHDGWTLDRDPTGRWVVTDPDGRVWTGRPPPGRGRPSPGA